MAENDPILSGLDLVRSYLRGRYEASEAIEHPDVKAAERELVSRCMAAVDDACEALQFDDR